MSTFMLQGRDVGKGAGMGRNVWDGKIGYRKETHGCGR